MIYLASPYSHSDPAVMEERFDAACKAAGYLMTQGHHVFSPIAQCHPIAMRTPGMPTDWQFWKAYDEQVIAACDELWVLMLDGWQESRGVAAEKEIAFRLGKPIRHASPVGPVMLPRD